MTVENIRPSVEYTYKDPSVNNEWPFTFQIFKAEDLVVELRNSTNDLYIPMSASDYTIDIINNLVITSKVLPDYTNVVLRIFRHVDRTQETNYVNNDPLNVKTIERDFDKAIMLIQELDATITRVMSSPEFKGEWQPSTLYKIGDLVKHGGSYYRSIAFGPSGTTFQPSRWIEYLSIPTIAEDIKATLAITPRPNFFDKSFVANASIMTDATHLLLHFTPGIENQVDNFGAVYFTAPDMSQYQGGQLFIIFDNPAPQQFEVFVDDTNNWPTNGQLVQGVLYGVVISNNKATLINAEKLPTFCVSIGTDTNTQLVSTTPKVTDLTLTPGMRFTYNATFKSEAESLSNIPYGVKLDGMTKPIILRTPEGDYLPEGAVQPGSMHTFVVTYVASVPADEHTAVLLTQPSYNKITRPNMFDISSVFPISGNATDIYFSPEPAVDAYFEGLEFYFKAVVDSTGAVMTHIGTSTPVELLTLDGATLLPGMLKAGMIHHCICVDNGGTISPRLLNPYTPAVQTVSTFDDNILLLDADVVGTPPATTVSGIEVNRGSEPNVKIVWEEQWHNWSLKGERLAELGDPEDESQAMTLGFANAHYPLQATAISMSSNVYAVSTGINIPSMAVDQLFIINNTFKNTGAVQLNIDGTGTYPLMYLFNGQVYDLLPGEFAGPLTVLFNGTAFIACSKLNVPADLVYRTTSSYPTTYFTPAANVWTQLEISAMPANPLFTKVGNVIKALQPCIVDVIGTTRHRNGDVSLRTMVNGVGKPFIKYNASSGEYAHITAHGGSVVLDKDDTVHVQYYAYTGCELRRDINKLEFTVVGRP